MKIEDLISKVRELVNANPDNKYNRPEHTQRCCYSAGVCDNGSVGCVFGQALVLLGEELDPEWDKKNMSITTILADQYDMGYSTERMWCNKLQAGQDGGFTWRQSMEAADELFSV